jgi:hypothetical protein
MTDAESLKKKGLAAAAVAQDTFEQLKAEGFCKHFQEYNVELLKPLKQANKLSLEGLQTAVVGFLTCKSSSKLEAQVGFILFNVLTFWLGAAEALFQLNVFGILWNAGLSCEAGPISQAHASAPAPAG